MKKQVIPIIIPAYEPDERLVLLLEDLKKADMAPIIIVNDGSDSSYNRIFDKAKNLSDVIIVHEYNQGKGKALKTAFDYVLKKYPYMLGVVTADSDGQHSVECIKKVITQLNKTPKSLVLGVRNFDEDGVPWKSQFGNKITRKLLSYIAGIKIQDTQTGLRAIPKYFLQDCLNLPGDRFEFETQMLLASSNKLDIVEVQIKTIYDSAENHQTHFNPIKDSIKIYKVLGHQFLKYLFSSVSSFLLDISLFALFMSFSKSLDISYKILLATVFARSLSILYNFLINYRFVFNSRESVFKSSIKYLVLAGVQMCFSGMFVVGLNMIMPFVSITVIKIFVDSILFIISYFIQRRFVF